VKQINRKWHITLEKCTTASVLVAFLPLARYMLWLVRLSQVGVLSKWQNESRWVFGTGTSTNPAMCRVKIRLSRKIKVLLPGTSSQTRDLQKFCHGESKRGVVNKTRRRSSLWTAPVTVDALRPHARSLLRARRSIRVYSLWSMKRKPISPTSG